MKCQFCEKPATFHITELTEPTGPQVMHLCEEHAKGFLHKGASSPMAAIATALAKQLGQSGDDLEELDQKECPVCGITFREFRNSGRLGCPYDYTHFEADLRPLLINVHDRTDHAGKHPQRSAGTADSQARMIKLRSEMEEAIKSEDYERASEIRDELKNMAAPLNPPNTETDDQS
ncbi:UvrB/UvrC motif-containing protein [Roseiconus lacunae]|uniref:UvrB/UvrC motif-containing protein n=1 Tax=Roseiconus lacunae TaxID=2605694 RepID=A0ABT7PC67_9BACT|nr:UvrB/UvrC motif-containing protein [Roseiconus lacunae]MCD0463466.1 UvrB/UvrC motif-containing protein [Roseiconus lacunae]MDM4014084.1 UvrB/UvrC motif-containing protein [Roseiconus lacunae]WRQ53375.1 UvrB/UvrC motif-containing protein [Stieleria sp. HD01]